VRGRPVPDAPGERAEAEGVVEPQLLERQAPAQEVQVAVDEAGHEEAPSEVHHVGALGGVSPDLGAGPHGEDLRAAHGEGLDERPARLSRPDPAVHEDPVGLRGLGFLGRRGGAGERRREGRGGEDRHATRQGTSSVR
jgi:hypothetical protein